MIKLEKEKKNKIWLRVLKNSFAPLFVGEFDYVVGNPPWVLWDNLPEYYRNATKILWDKYRLFTLSGMAARHGGGKKDISILFTYTCLDRYLKNKGCFGFLITQAVFKTKGAGEGFRRLKVKNTPVKVISVHDFVEVKPFEGANNRTAAIFLKKGESFSYPVPYILWRPRRPISQTDDFDEALRKLEEIKMLAKPSDERNPLSPWLTLPEKAFKAVQKARGRSSYKCYAGIYSGGANAVYWFRIIGIQGEKEANIDVPLLIRKFFGSNIKKLRFVFVENITEGMKKKIGKIRTVIEDFFIYPLIKTRHVNRWKINGYIYTLQMQDPIKRIGYDEHWVKINFPKTYSYLKGFESLLRKRSSSVVRQLMEKGPFYSMYAVGEYTYAPYKVVWNQMGNKLSACVISKVNDKFLGEKLILPEHVLAFIPTDKPDEAHYLCAILNSSITDLILRSIAGGTKSFGTPKIIEDSIKIPKYNPNNKMHIQLSALSKKAHKFASQNNIYELSKVEEEVDKIVAKIYGITDEELKEIKKTLKILQGEEIEEEKEEKIPILEPNITILNPVISENKPSNIEIFISNPSNKTITNAKLKAELPTTTIEQLFQKIEKEEKLTIPIDGLKRGKYKVKLILDYAAKEGRKKIEKELILYVKEEKKKKVKGGISIEELFG